MCRLASVFAVAGVILGPSPLAAQKGKETVARWPQFRGPNALGVAVEDMKLPVKFGPDQNLIWKTPLPSGQSSPCIWDGRIFLTSFENETKKLDTICIDRKTGNELWRRTAPTEKIERVHKVGSPAVATPATDGERLYVYFGSYGLLCYDFEGKELWKNPLPLPMTVQGTGTSPVVMDELVILNREFRPEPTLLAVDKLTGEDVWTQPRKMASVLGPPDGYSTPVVWQHDGIREILINSPTRLTAHDAKDGTERWSVRTSSQACTTPVVGGDQVFVAAHWVGTEAGEEADTPPFDDLLKRADKDADGFVTSEEFPKDMAFFKRSEATNMPGTTLHLGFFFGGIDTDKDRKISREEWDKWVAEHREFTGKLQNGLLGIKAGGSGDVTETHVLWKEKRAVPEVPSPLYYRDRIYVVRDGGLASCLDAKTGRVLYRERLRAEGAYFASPVAGDGKVYFSSKNGIVVVVEACDQLKVLARNDIGEPISATPALVDGKVYVRTDNHLYAFGDGSR